MYVKIFSQILDSSIARDSGMRRMFQDLLILANSDGIVDMTYFAIAQRLVLPEEEVRKQIAKLCKPDPESRSHADQGRRLVKLDKRREWGWLIINYQRYRNLTDEDTRKEQDRVRARRYRQNKKLEDHAPSRTVTPRHAKEKQLRKSLREGVKAEEQPADSRKSEASGSKPGAPKKRDLRAELLSRLVLEEEFRRDGSTLIKEGKRWKCLCPFHAEGTPSCKIENGRFRCFSCHASGDVLNYIAKKIGKTCSRADFPDVLRDGCRRAGIPFQEVRKKPLIFKSLPDLRNAVKHMAASKGGTLDADFAYRKHGRDVLVVFRIHYPQDVGKYKKSFLQATPCVAGWQFTNSLPQSPLFREDELKDETHVLIVEGEKKVEALLKLEIPATCNAGGSDCAGQADWSSLAGKTLTIWRDNDDGGKTHEAAVIESCRQLTSCSIRRVKVELLGLQHKDDVIEFLARYPEADQFNAVSKVIDENTEWVVEETPPF
jgi:hypothetical protein